MPERKPDRSLSVEDRVSVLTEYAPALHRFLRGKFAGNGADLEDLMQEIWKVWVALPAHIAVEDPVKYLFGIARNIGNRHLATVLGSPVDYRPCTPGRPLESPEQVVIEAAEAEAVGHDLVRQIEKLPRSYQEVLRLKMQDNLSIKEIAKELGLSEASVKKYLVKAKARLGLGGA